MEEDHRRRVSNDPFGFNVMDYGITEAMNLNQPGILVMTNQKEIIHMVESAIKLKNRFAVEDVCWDLQELVAHLERAPSAAVLVDLDPDPTQMLVSLEPIAKRFANTRFIVLSSSMSDNLVLEAMQVGARHFMTRGSIESELDGVLSRLILNGSAKETLYGKVITVLSTSGGCGATTLAINLANELQLMSSKSSLVVDLDSSYGAVASYLGLHGQFGVADVLARLDKIDPELVRSTALAYSDDLHVLINPVTIDPVSPVALEYPRLYCAIQSFKSAYQYTVIDAPRVPIDVVTNLITASDITLVMFQLTVKDITTTRSLLSAIKSRKVAADRLIPLVNRYHKRRTMITLSEAQKALHMNGTSLRYMSNDYRGAISSLNYGRTLAQTAPRSAFRREIKQLAEEIAKAQKRQSGTINHGEL
ncbi:MAG: AAA family ATPase [Planctomycetota bacterium]|jgi:pilus assembly protein CpaE